MLHQGTSQQPGIGVQFWRLTKPRVVSLIVFTAVIGMLLAAPTLPPAGLLAAARGHRAGGGRGRGVLASASSARAAVAPHAAPDDHRHHHRRADPAFSGVVGGLGVILWHAVNLLTIFHTRDAVGYAIVLP